MNDIRKSIHDKNRMTAAAITAAVTLVLLIWMITTNLDISLDFTTDRKWPPVDSSEIVFGGEFVKLGDFSQPLRQNNRHTSSETQTTEEPSHDATDLQNSGPRSAEEPEIISSERTSPAKIEKKEKPEKTGPSKEELAERERIRQEREQAQKSKKINSGMKNTFNKPGKATDGKEGSPHGNSTIGSTSGSPGYSLKGRTAEGWGRPSSTHGGTITITVKVNRQGHVVSATYAGGTGSAAAQPSVRQSCIQAARQSRFSVDENAPAEQTGTITWTFR